MSSKYYRTNFDEFDEEGWEIKIPFSKEIWSYSRCELADSQKPVKLDLSSIGEERDFNLTSFNVPIVSAKLRNIIEAVSSPEVQFIPTDIESEKTWFIANAISSVSCVDFEKSVLDYFIDEETNQKKIKAARPLRILPDAADGHHFFRIKEWMIPLIISEELHAKMKEASVSGFAIFEV